MGMRKLAAVLAIVLMSSFAFVPSGQARFKDADKDGVGNRQDQCKNTTNIGGETQIDDCSGTVTNVLFANGCTVEQRNDDCFAESSSLDDLKDCLKGIVNDLKDGDIITKARARALRQCINHLQE